MSVKLISSLERLRVLPQITLGHILLHVEEDALAILCLIAILPLMQPIPVPGLSSVIGLVVLFQGIGLMLWSKPLLNKKLRDFSISHDKFEKIYLAAKKLSNLTSKVSVLKHPLSNSRLSHILCGLSIIVSAIFLALPLPIPLSNLVPAVSIFLICIGLLEDDILLILGGISVSVAVIWMANSSYHVIEGWIRNWL